MRRDVSARQAHDSQPDSVRAVGAALDIGLPSPRRFGTLSRRSLLAAAAATVLNGCTPEGSGRSGGRNPSPEQSTWTPPPHAETMQQELKLHPHDMGGGPAVVLQGLVYTDGSRSSWLAVEALHEIPKPRLQQFAAYLRASPIGQIRLAHAPLAQLVPEASAARLVLPVGVYYDKEGILALSTDTRRTVAKGDHAAQKAVIRRDLHHEFGHFLDAHGAHSGKVSDSQAWRDVFDMLTASSHQRGRTRWGFDSDEKLRGEVFAEAVAAAIDAQGLTEPAFRHTSIASYLRNLCGVDPRRDVPLQGAADVDEAFGKAIDDVIRPLLDAANTGKQQVSPSRSLTSGAQNGKALAVDPHIGEAPVSVPGRRQPAGTTWTQLAN